MSSVRAKFDVTGKDAGEIGMVYLGPVYNGSEENKTFWEATPGGTIQLYITNPPAFKFFEIGKEYYIDFTPAE